METGGNAVLSGRLWDSLLRLAGPMFVSMVLQNAQSLIDLFWVGRLGSDAVAALAISGTLLMMLFPAVMGLSTGTVAIVARAIGGGRDEEASSIAGQSLGFAVGCGVFLGAAGWLWAGPLCRMLGAVYPVADLGAQYLGISFVGSFTMFVLFIGNSILQAAGNTMIPMYAMLLANLLNLVLDPVLIFGWAGVPALGVAGAAWATVISQGVAAAWVFYVLHTGVSGVRVGLKHWRPNPSLWWRLLRVGLPSSGQMLTRSLMNLVLMRVVAHFGMVAVAAYGIGMRFHMIVLMPAFVLGNAAAVLVGQNLGAGKPDRAVGAAWLAVAIDVVLMIGSALILVLFARPLVAMFDKHPDVVRTGVAYLRIVSPFHLFAAFSIVLGRALQGAGETVSPMVMTIIGLWLFQVPLAMILPRFFAVQSNGVWWAISVALAVHGLMVTAWFSRGAWKTQRV